MRSRSPRAGKTKLYLLNADPADGDEVDWSAFPGVRRTLAQWGALPEGSSTADVGDKLGIHLPKVSTPERDPVRAIVRFVNDHDNDLIVLATHGRDGLPRWLHGAVPEPAAREADTPTLFLPRGASGFVDPKNGALRLKTSWSRSITGPTRRRRCARPSGCAARSRHPRSRCTWCTSGSRATCRRSRSRGIRRSGSRARRARARWSTRSWPRRANLIAMATAGHQGFLDALRGSTTERVLRDAPCPVLAAPAD